MVGTSNHAAAKFLSSEKTLIHYFRHEVFHEYERAKLEIFDRDFNQQHQKLVAGINESPFTPFHPVFMSTLMN